METIFLLVETEVGQLESVLQRMKAVPGVAEVEAVTGPFDLIVKVQAAQLNTALDTVIHKIRKIPGIKSTETLVTVATGEDPALVGPEGRPTLRPTRVRDEFKYRRARGRPMVAVGEIAPKYHALTQDGAPFASDSLRGKRVVLYFYPKADTPGCDDRGEGIPGRAPPVPGEGRGDRRREHGRLPRPEGVRDQVRAPPSPSLPTQRRRSRRRSGSSARPGRRGASRS